MNILDSSFGDPGTEVFSSSLFSTLRITQISSQSHFVFEQKFWRIWVSLGVSQNSRVERARLLPPSLPRAERGERTDFGTRTQNTEQAAHGSA